MQHPLRSDGTNKTTYVYDSANQLIRENNQAAGKTTVWTYDNAGNIKSRKEYAYTTGTLGTQTDSVTYTYDNDNWGDLLTKYDGTTITYDAIGNPLSDGTWTYTWEHGRELRQMTDGTNTWTFTYNADGLRTKRVKGNTAYEYVYLGGQLAKMTVDGIEMHFAYDAEGKPISVYYNQSVFYYYITNLQGDVVAIVDTDGNKVVSYTYDAWGNVLTTTGSKASTVGRYNPLRYRGYVYDSETELYYLQSRYYNPEWGRFLNADALASTGQGILGNNMFAYCQNNPVIYADPDGLCREVGALLTWIDCKSVFCSTSSAYRPHFTPKVDITERLNAAMVEHEQELKDFSDSHNLIETGLFFKEKVKNGGAWDLKNQPDWCLSQYVTYTYNGVDYRHDAIGNIHYGYVGSAAFSDEVLLMMAGYAQISAGTWKWYYAGSWFDDPYDQMAIRVGCELWDEGAIK